jgi:hypothetical protein
MSVTELVERAQVTVDDRRIQEMAEELQRLLGQKLVAFALGDRHPKSIGRYARGDRTPDAAAHRGLVDLYVIVEILRQGMRDRTIKSWMLGANPRLNGRAPVEVFHEGRAYDAMNAAAAFVSSR